MSDGIGQYDFQQGRTMGWHNKTDVVPDLSLQNSRMRPEIWDYIAKTVYVDRKQGAVIKKAETPFRILGVTDIDDLEIGIPYNPDTFKPLTLARLIPILETAMKDINLPLESCGRINNASRIFFSFNMEENFTAGDRQFKSFLNIGNGNTKMEKTWINTSNICTVCQNTYELNLQGSGMIMEIKKTKFSEIKLPDLGKAIGFMVKGQKEFAKAFGKLALTKCDENQAREFFAGFLAIENCAIESPLSTRSQGVVDNLVVMFRSGKGNDGNDYSDVFQAITDYYSHEAASGRGDGNANWKNFLSSEYGAGRNSKQAAWEILNNEASRKSTVLIGKKVLKLTAQALKDAEKAK